MLVFVGPVIASTIFQLASVIRDCCFLLEVSDNVCHKVHDVEHEVSQTSLAVSLGQFGKIS